MCLFTVRCKGVFCFFCFCLEFKDEIYLSIIWLKNNKMFTLIVIREKIIN